MVLDVPYYKQDTIYSCGATAVQMLLRFFGITASERELMKRLETNADVGTRHRPIIEELLKHNLFCYANEESTLDEVFYYISKHSLPVLVHYVEPKFNEGHYALIIGNKNGNVLMNDPWYGPNFALSYETFLHRWNDGKGKYNQWMLVASREELHLGKQYRPANEDMPG